ncbi:MAG TPA: endonuclease [Lacibacter sp.]|nr:endonuclease [Lacibacter sp.]
MRKFYLFLFSFLAIAASTLSQGTETFTNMPAANSSYLTRTWTGDNGLGWTATDARTDLTITGRAITIRNGYLSCAEIPNGIASLSFKHQQQFTGSNPVLQIYINGNLIGTVNPTSTVATATLNNIDVSGNFDLEIRQVTTGLRIAIDDLTWTSYNATPCVAPTAQPTALNLTPASPTEITGVFNAAIPVADAYLVVRTLAGAPAPVPVNGNVYTAGQSIGSGTVVENDANTNFSAAGLAPATAYTFYIFSHNNLNCSGGPLYVTSNPLTGNATTQALAPCSAPAAAPTALTLTAANTSINGSFTASATANRYLVVRSSNATLSATPANGTTYSQGQSLGGGVVVSYSNAVSFLAGGLTPNTQYYFFVFAANGDCSGEPFYNTTALSDTKTTTNNQTNLPPNYYNAAAGLTCAPLKTALSTILSTNVTQLSYSGVWTAYAKTDIKRNFENTRDIIWDMYSNKGEGQNEPYEYVYGINQCGNYSGEGSCYNREHSFPASWFGDGFPMYSDVNHLFPTDGYVNNIRGSLPFGEVTTPNFTTLNGSKRGNGNNFGYTGIVFEPINEYKGDFARATLYMVTRYDAQVASWQNNGTANEILNGTAYPAFDEWHIKLLYKWHLQDPVSQKEIARNDSIYVVQGNRNPYIDNPQYVFDVWSCTGFLTTTNVNDVLNLPSHAVRLYPNPSVNSTITVKLEKAFQHNITIQVMDVMGRVIDQQVVPAGQTLIQLQSKSLNKGMYIMKMNTKNGIVTRNFIVQ